MLLVATPCSLSTFEDVREGFYLASWASGPMCFLSCASHIRAQFTCSDQKAFQVADLVLLRRRTVEGTDSNGCAEILCLVEKAAKSGGRREQLSLEVLVSAAVKGSGALHAHQDALTHAQAPPLFWNALELVRLGSLRRHCASGTVSTGCSVSC